MSRQIATIFNILFLLKLYLKINNFFKISFFFLDSSVSLRDALLYICLRPELLDPAGAVHHHVLVVARREIRSSQSDLWIRQIRMAKLSTWYVGCQGRRKMSDKTSKNVFKMPKKCIIMAVKIELRRDHSLSVEKSVEKRFFLMLNVYRCLKMSFNNDYKCLKMMLEKYID